MLDTADDAPILMLQKVDHASRFHLDIETDNVETDVAHLERLGATRVTQVKDWWVLQAPSGHRFCVVPQQRTPCGAHLNRWA